MISYYSGDLLRSDTDAIVNAVNTVGVMGKGLALQFRNEFPLNYKKYQVACKNGGLQPGKLLLCRDHNPAGEERVIVNFPTKIHWRLPSQYEYVEEGLKALVKLISEEKIKSIAIPPLGCGLGGLDWAIVKPMMISYMEMVDADVRIYEPKT
ncbi:macro domain-containing protein [Terrimonas sp. NA20]|uniref:Macro domain-containing protein n=1 Tax=Terrimonas ginsenosidimutans TaxID=2908004 RepID=A0ABS9KKL5_9BACT|nr:macro domain-containing protein [Terrimonas ginsenosidimutans]MCG2612844.1 macro domain-containing protein [Terrimonas ginsenosidimutans]